MNVVYRFNSEIIVKTDLVPAEIERIRRTTATSAQVRLHAS